MLSKGIMQLARLCPWADLHLVGGMVEEILYWKRAGFQHTD